MASEDMKYVVDVIAPLPDDLGPVVKSVAEAFNIGEDRAATLLNRAPGTVTKPVAEREAKAVARIFLRAGLKVAVRPQPGAPPERSETAERRPQPVAAVAQAASGSPLAAEVREPAVEVETAAPAAAEPLGTEPVAAEPVATDPAADEPAVHEPAAAEPAAEEAVSTSSSRWGGAEVAAGSRSATRSEFDFDPVEIPEIRGQLRPRRRRSLQRRLLAAWIVPALLAVAFSLAAAALLARSAFQDLLFETARNPAHAFAEGVEAALTDTTLSDPVTVQRLHQMALATQEEFRRQNIAFVLITSAEGTRLAGWYLDEPGFTGVPGEVVPALREQVRRASGTVAEVEVAAPESRQIDLGDGAVEVAANPIWRDGVVEGAVLVGIGAAAEADRRLLEILPWALGAGLIPVLLGFLVALALVRGLTRRLGRLVETAEKISRGDLAQSIEAESDAELDDLATAIERMRVSLQEGMDRLRRRRR